MITSCLIKITSAHRWKLLFALLKLLQCSKFTREVGIFIINFPWDIVHQKLMNSVYFSASYLKNKWEGVVETQNGLGYTRDPILCIHLFTSGMNSCRHGEGAKPIMPRGLRQLCTAFRHFIVSRVWHFSHVSAHLKLMWCIQTINTSEVATSFSSTG